MTLDKNHFRMIPDLIGLRYQKNPTDDRGFFYCPFHAEKIPSLSISFVKGVWHCFSCHRGGSLNELCKQSVDRNIYQVLGLDNEFKDFGKNRKIVYDSEPINTDVKEEDVTIDIRGVVVSYNKSRECLEYMKVRGISESIAEKYDLKYAEDIYINKRKFIKRLLVPIKGESGRIVNIEGRDITRKSNIKVLYPAESIKPIFNIQNLDPKKPLIITEGLIDLFLLEQDEYFNNVTVIFGSAISPYQKKILDKFDKIITIFNNDDAGERALEMLRKELNKKIDKLEFSKDFNDIGEIWEYGKMTVKEYREKYGFFLRKDNSFFL